MLRSLKLRKRELCNLPTPIEFYEEIEQNNIYIKRDDFTNHALGGNKARKLEYFLSDALINKHDCIVTYGSHQSNHNRLTASAASIYGLKTILIIPKDKNIKFRSEEHT